MSRLDKGQRTLIERFDQAWRSGKPPDLKRSLPKLLAASPGLKDVETRREFLTELVSIDLEYRWRRSNEGSTASTKTYLLEDYASLDPVFGSCAEMSLELIAAEYRARQAWGDAPTPESYLERFPSHGPVLAQRLAEVEQETAKSGAKLPRIEGLKLLSKIGRGSFGVVYKAKQIDAKRTVAVKVVQIDSDQDKEAFARFLKEAQSIARIKHPNVVTLYHSGMTELKPYLVMEYASGGTLRKRLHEWRKKWNANLPPDQTKWQRHVASLVHDIARGLAAAHAQQVVHRDLKPENVLFDSEQRPMIADFGLAREEDEALSTRGAGEGTREYQAPEQIAREKKVDVRADIYSLGVILFEMLTGDHPFTGPLVEAQVADPARYAPTPREINPAVNRDLEAICEKCLQKSPERRFETATALADDLERFLTGEPIVTRPITGRERVQRFLWFHRMAVGFSAALLLSVTIGTGIGIRQYVQNREIAASEKKTRDEKDEADRKRKEAEEDAKQKELAIAEEKKRVVREQQRANQEQQAREIAKRNNQLHDYASDMQTIQRSWNEGNRDQVKELLVRHDPAKNGGASDVRGFEWYYWNHLVQDNGSVIQHCQAPRCLAVDRSGKLLAVSDFEGVTVWDLDTKAQVWTRPITGHRQGLFSPDRSLPMDRSVCFSRDGNHIAGIGFVVEERGRFGTIKVWNAQSGDELLSVEDDRSISGRTIVFDPTSDRVVAGGYRNGWKCWNLKSKKLELESAGEKEEEGSNKRSNPLNQVTPWELVTEMSFSDDGERLFVSCHPKTPGLSWRWPFGPSAGRIPAGMLRPETRGVLEWGGRLPAGNVQAGPDGNWRVVQALDKQLHLFTKTGLGARKPIVGVMDNSRSDVRDAVIAPPESISCFSLQGFHLVAGGTDQMVYSWSINQNDGKPIAGDVLRGHGSEITAVTSTPQGKPISADRSGAIRVWTDDRPEIIRLDVGPAGPAARQTMPDPSIEILDASGAVQARIPIDRSEHLFQSTMSPLQRLMVLSVQGHLQPPRHRFIVWDLKENRAVLDRSYGPSLLSCSEIALSQDETTLAAVTSEHHVSIWNLATGEELSNVPASMHAVLALNETGSLLAIGGSQFLSKQNDPITIWDTKQNEEVTRIVASTESTRRKGTFVFTSEDRLVVDGSPSTLWNARTGEQLPATLGDIIADSAQTSQDRRRLYFVSGDTIEICCAKTFRPLLKFKVKMKENGPSPGLTQAVGGAGGFLASGDLDRRLNDLVETWQHQDAQ